MKPESKTTKPLSDMPPSIRDHGRDVLALVEQSIRSAYLKGVADGHKEALDAKR